MRKHGWTRVSIAAPLLLWWGCSLQTPGQPAAPAERTEPAATEAQPPHVELPPLDPDAEVPRLPHGGGIYPQTFLRLSEGDPRDTEHLADVETCAECHADVAASWRSSAHARASVDNPWYRQAFDSLREEVGTDESRLCAGCHDPVLLIAGAIDEPIRPDDPRAHIGIPCMLCHGIQETRTDGASSFTLRTGPVPLPDPADEEEIAEHVAALTPSPLRTAELCGSCHRAFLGPFVGVPHHLGGLDDVTPWQRSGFAGSRATRIDDPVDQETCQGCHMPQGDASLGDMAADEQGHFPVHRVAGGHTALAAATGDDVQLQAIRESLRETARIDVASVRTTDRARRWIPSDRAAVEPGDALEIDVVVRNLLGGHRFPSGTLDAQDTWIEVEVHDAAGSLVAEAGTRHAEGEEDDPTAHRFMAVVVNERGEPRFEHRVQTFRAKIFDTTIGPRDAGVVRYAFDVPEDAALPLSVRARLRHRRHPRALHRAACESQQSRRGRAFFAASVRLGRAPIDACAPQPITELADALVWIGEGADDHHAQGGATAMLFQRHFDHGLGLLGDVQEHADDARAVLDAAFIAAPDDLARAMVFGQRARLEARQGRLEHAVRAADRAEGLIGPHPAIDRLRGDAYAAVWRWDDAALAYASVAVATQLDDSAWADLARARGSAGDNRGALDAALRGLALQPRDAQMLRSQYLAIDGLGLPGVDAARQAYLDHRVPDVTQELQLLCGRNDEWCARERLPVHVHAMRVPTLAAAPSGSIVPPP